MIRVSDITDSLLQFLFPHVCAGCGNDNLSRQSTICLPCLESLPETGFEYQPDNPVEKSFWGRVPVESAAAHLYFARGSLVQQLMHQLKYKGNREVGIQLGRLMGNALRTSGRFDADALVPLPLFASRERKRGYNQSALLCRGIAETYPLPVIETAVYRTMSTETQTKKGRIERWQDMEGRFVVKDPSSIEGKSVLLVDDVITTGATLEACGSELLKTEGVRLSIATLCFASKV